MVHRILKQIKELRKDERTAPGHYQKLRNLIPYKGDKALITRIQRQERKHFKELNRLHHKYERIGRRLKREGKEDID